MKPILFITFFFTSLLSGFFALAQPSFKKPLNLGLNKTTDIPLFDSFYAVMPSAFALKAKVNNSNEVYKTDAVKSRLIAKTYLENKGNGLEEADTTSFLYSNGRGGDDQFEPIYADEEIAYSVKSGVLENNYKYVNSYSVSNYYSCIYYNGNGSLWNQDSRTTVFYNTKGNDSIIVTENFNSGKWNNQSSRLLKYDLANRVKEITNSEWSGTKWVPNWQYLYSYDSLNRYTKFTYNLFTNGSWEPSSCVNYSYLANKTSYAVYANWVNNAWDTIYRYFVIYNNDSNVISEIKQNYSNGNWNYYDQRTYSYNGKKRTSNTYAKYLNGAWVNQTRDIISYDASDNVSQVASDRWVTNKWVPDYVFLGTYNSFNQYLTKLQRAYKNGIWEDQNLYRYYYETYTPSGINDINTITQSAVYPNPFTQNTIIDFEVTKAGEYTIQFADMNGRIISSVNQYCITGTNSHFWQPENLPAGMYVYCVSGNGGKTFGKLFKQ